MSAIHIVLAVFVDNRLLHRDMSVLLAWYILSSIGLYQLSPGSENFVIGSPRFPKVVVDISDNVDATSSSSSLMANKNHMLRSSTGKTAAESVTLTIIANNQGKDNVYVQSVSFNGVKLDIATNTIPYKTLAQGGTLTFEMGPQPVGTTY